MAEDAPWGELYRAAMFELEISELPKRIEAASAAIRWRMEQLSTSNHDGGAVEERQRMVDALANLQTLQRVELRSPTKHGTDGDKAPGGEESL